jgi:hypothetical protein
MMLLGAADGRRHDPETVRELPDRRARTAEEFVRRLRQTVTELVAMAGEIDLAGYAKRAKGG